MYGFPGTLDRGSWPIGRSRGVFTTVAFFRSGIYTCPFPSSCPWDVRVRGASLISHSTALCKRYRLYACVRATGLVAPSRLSLLLVHFRAPPPSLSFSLRNSQESASSFYPYHDTAYTIIEMVTGIFGEAKLECRLSTKSSQRSRPTATRSKERKRERHAHTHVHTWTRVFLHRAKWREAA